MQPQHKPRGSNQSSNRGKGRNSAFASRKETRAPPKLPPADDNIENYRLPNGRLNFSSRIIPENPTGETAPSWMNDREAAFHEGYSLTAYKYHKRIADDHYEVEEDDDDAQMTTGDYLDAAFFAGDVESSSGDVSATTAPEVEESDEVDQSSQSPALGGSSSPTRSSATSSSDSTARSSSKLKDNPPAKRSWCDVAKF